MHLLQGIYAVLYDEFESISGFNVTKRDFRWYVHIQPPLGLLSGPTRPWPSACHKERAGGCRVALRQCARLDQTHLGLPDRDWC